MNSYLSNGLRWLVLIGQLACSTYAVAAPQNPVVDDKEMQQLEAELAEFNKMYENMSEKEKTEFNAMMQDAVEEVRKGLSDEGKQLFEKLEGGNISDEEIDKLLNELVPTPESPAPTPVVEEPVKEPIAEKPAPKTQPKQVITSKHQRAIDCIKSLVTHTNSFIVKAGSLPEFPNKLKNWEKKGSITWKKGQTWNTFKHELEKFVSQLNKIIERDKKTGDYLHIDELLAHESIYNNLSKLEKTISSLEPKIEEVSPLTKKLSPESKTALQKTISQYHEALFTLQLPQDLAQLLEKFEPKAKVMRESQEAAQKKAVEESKRPRVPGAPVVGGRADVDSGYGYSPSSYDSGYSSGYGSHDSYAPSYGAYVPETLGEFGSKQASATPGKGGQMGSTAGKSENEKTVDKTGAPGSKPGQPAEQAQNAQGTKRSQKNEDIDEIKNLRRKIETSLDNVVTAIETTQSFADMKAFAKSADPVDLELANKILPTIFEDLTSKRKGILGNLEALKMSINSHKLSRPYYKGQLQEMLKSYEKTLSPFLNQLNELEKEWPTISSQILPIKQFAYFGGEKPQPIPALQFTPEQGQALDKKAEQINKENISVEEKQQKMAQTLKDIAGLTDKQIEEQMQAEQNKDVLSQLTKPTSLFEINKALHEVLQVIQSF